MNVKVYITKWASVQSSMIRRVHYEPLSHSLTVQFNNNAVYRYQDVPATMHKGLLEAQSKGKYFLREIRGGYKWERLS